ncbi:MAG TPA: DUF1801 domain-containing protein [Bacteroidia bacterium]|jgi:hypothetical protein|nr:DUF1801 domain-containing protein [Bacteroidia bacterium]
MATQNKTIETKNSVPAFIKKIANPKKRSDFSALVDLISKETKLEPKMWGTAIVGFGSYHYKYASGREGDAPLTGLAARSTSIVLYLGSEFAKRGELLAKFGKHKMSGGCVHIQKLEDIDQKVLKQMVKNSVDARKKGIGC